MILGHPRREDGATGYGKDMVSRRKLGSGVSGRTNDPERTRANILDVASEHFAQHGLSGGRIDDIAEQTNTSKRMIYYYFGSKEKLYEAVLERAYLDMRRIELEIDIPGMDPVDALRQIVQFTIDHQHSHPWFGRLVAIENIHHGEFLKRIPGIREHNATIIHQLEKLIEKGVAEGKFRDGLDPVSLHWMISAFAIFNVVNDYTFSYLFPVPGTPQQIQAMRRQIAADAVVRWCQAAP